MLDTKRTLENSGVLGRIILASEKAEIYTAESVRVTTPPERWAYAARVVRECYWHGRRCGGSIYLRMHVVQGEVGIGVLTADNAAYMVELRFPATASPQVTNLPVPLPEVGDLIIRNTAPGDKRSRVIFYQISVVPSHAGHPHFAEFG